MGRDRQQDGSGLCLAGEKGRPSQMGITRVTRQIDRPDMLPSSATNMPDADVRKEGNVTPGRTAIHCARYFIGLDEAETQVTRNERGILARYMANKRRAVEIGVFEGSTTRFLAEQMDREGEL